MDRKQKMEDARKLNALLSDRRFAERLSDCRLNRDTGPLRSLLDEHGVEWHQPINQADLTGGQAAAMDA